MWEQHLESLMNLMLQYKLTKDVVIFVQILERLEGLIVDIIVELKKNRRYLEQVSLNDLYQTAVIGVYHSVASLSEDKDPIMLPGWIKSYIKSHIKSVYKNDNMEIPISQIMNEDDEEFDILESMLGTYFHMYDSVEECRQKLDAEMFYENVYMRCVKEGVITEKEDFAIREHVMKGIAGTELAKRERIHRSTTRKRVKKGLDKVKVYYDKISKN